MSNNDPIKEYNSAAFKLERLREKFEMSGEKEEPITDLHDCSNDLSDRGSRLEELEHANFAEKMREKANQYSGSSANYNDAWKSRYEKNQNIKSSSFESNSFKVVICILVFAIIIIVKSIMLIAGEISNLTGYVIEDITNVLDDSSNTNVEPFKDLESIESIENVEEIEDTEDSTEEKNDDYYQDDNDIDETEDKMNFSAYINNIKFNTLETIDGRFFVKLYNKNKESFEDLKIKLCFYDQNNAFIRQYSVSVDNLFAEDEQYYEVYVPFEWATFEHELITENVKISNITKDGIVLENKMLKTNSPFFGEYISGDIELTNESNRTIDHVEVLVKYLKNGKIQKIDVRNLYNIIPGEKSTAYVNDLEYASQIDEIELSINELELY